MFYFAWVDASQTTFGLEHQVEDEEVFAFTVEHAEGEFASLSIEIKNPRIGLLAPARKTWAWLSWNSGTEVVPLFFGRLVGVPTDLHQEVVTLQFTARPADYNAQKQSLAEALKVAPFWDPIWIDPDQREDPDVVLEARSQLWHIDRVSHAVTISDVLIGEDGIEEFSEADVFYDGVAVRLNQPPLRTVSVEGVVNWKQPANGVVKAFAATTIATHTGDGLISGWPKAGANIGGGWQVASASAIDVSGISQMADDKFQIAGGAADNEPLREQTWPDDWIFLKTLDWSFMTAHLVEGVLIPLWQVATTLSLRYDAERQRQEIVRFTLSSDVQPIVTLPGEEELQTIKLSSTDVGDDIDGEVPIGDPRRRSYFPTDRGLRSLEYLLSLARAQLCLRSRAVEISFDCRFERAIALSCRKNVRVFDRRLPGGQALGKVIAYSFRADGDSGTLIGSVTIGCAVGYGGAIAEAPGEPNYVQESYVDGYQTYTGTTMVLGSGDIGYSVPVDAPNDDGLDLVHGIQAADVISGFQIANPPAVQRQALLGSLSPSSLTDSVVQAAREIFKGIPTKVQFTLKPVTGGPFQSVYDLNVSELKLPKMIDLEAAA